jgi:hypothetical protein
MRRPWIVVILIVFAVVGGFLIFTADETASVPLEDITTAEGLETRIPEGWVVSEQFPFDFSPPGDGQVFDQWTVARACPPDGCEPRTMAEWLALAPDLPTFTSLAEAESDLFDVELETMGDARVVSAQSEAAARLVFVAAFTDGAEDYVACSVQIGLTSDQRLAEAIVDACRDATRVG